MRGGWTGRRAALVGGAAAAVLLAAGLAAGSLGGSPSSALGAAAAPSAEPSRAPLLPALGAAPGSAPTAAGLQRALAAGLTDPSLGGPVAISVLDAVSGAPLLETRAAQVVLPASTAKIATAVAALTALPPDGRISTRVVAGSGPGEVVVVGGGDPTLAGARTRAAYPPVARLSELAAQVKAALGAVPVRRVVVDDSLYAGPVLGPGWSTSYVNDGDVAPVMALQVEEGRVRPYPDKGPRVQDPALAAGTSLAALLQPAGQPAPTVARGRAGAGARQLAEVRSPTVQQLVEMMLSRSDNDLAEALARQVALAKGQPASFGGGAAAVQSVLAGVLPKVGAAPGSVLLADGSGLSRFDRVQPGTLTRLLSAIAGADRARYFPVLSGLPVAGFDGTLEKRFRTGPGLPAAGAVRAKTGTLNGVSALAGLVRTRDGRLLAFDLTADGVPAGATLASQRALDGLAAALAGCGCR
ncbi:MAG: D-alanyl-D-alanine carboxypeptidase (penicillin-binding protein 4)-like protein [Frankiales bacterium]|nr:D-alanyl-D-alanine carboxypeptidase (penicillin-binding protein 4)-like protein [Frankiales bacterium]